MQRWTTDWTLDTIAVGAEQRFTAQLSTSSVKPGRYTVLIQGTNPLPSGQPVRFADADQDATVAGWLTLGRTAVRP
ncbi:hypothetical protein [Microbacterium kyungheense]|uniref:hypothetical protein n=1 Tax=Microbacterium kyungheense TaxID=1263636 RepID=UPI00114DE799|nr:hypothetical protein [Microbacterium kyungheense]